MQRDSLHDGFLREQGRGKEKTDKVYQGMWTDYIYINHCMFFEAFIYYTQCLLTRYRLLSVAIREPERSRANAFRNVRGLAQEVILYIIQYIIIIIIRMASRLVLIAGHGVN